MGLKTESGRDTWSGPEILYSVLRKGKRVIQPNLTQRQ